MRKAALEKVDNLIRETIKVRIVAGIKKLYNALNYSLYGFIVNNLE